MDKIKYEIEVKYIKGTFYYGGKDNEETSATEGAINYINRPVNPETFQRVYALPIVKLGNRRNNNAGGKMYIGLFHAENIKGGIKAIKNSKALAINNNVVKVANVEIMRIFNTFKKPILMLETQYASIDNFESMTGNKNADYNNYAKGFEMLVRDCIANLPDIDKKEVKYTGSLKPNGRDLLQACDIVFYSKVPIEFLRTK